MQMSLKGLNGVSQQVSPSWRDFQVYRLVKIEQRSTREAAGEMQLSQTRVCQIVSRVAEFLLANTPGADDEEQQRRQVRLAEQLAAERIEFLQRQALQGFDRSQEIVEVQGQQIVSGGDPRFLYLAARLALMSAKLPTPILNDVVFAAEPDEIADESADDMHPSKEDCSPLSQLAPKHSPRTPSANEAKPLPPESSIECVSVDLLAKLQQKAPVQPAAGARNPTVRRESKPDRRAAFLAGS